MKTSTSEGKYGIQWKSRMHLDDLDFADDLDLLSQTQQQMQEKTTSVAAASAAIGLNIDKGKSKVLRYNTACTNPITIDGEDLEDVKTFTYLGSIIDEHGGSDAGTDSQLQLGVSDHVGLTNEDGTGIQCLTTLLPATPNIICTHREKSKDRVEEIGRVYLAITNIC
ncbi:unnamed protein product [Schistosoma margrebowiei]|uniref:Uncharacterized protein n=1 Tax=Schistosoma margrebowiei TaxID=48269 RepID=A0A183MY98_9TREM|nr:unnamed protein product [Schistosoma margrebowiei]